MSQHANFPRPPVDQFERYLTFMAYVELDPSLRGKIDPADVVQQTMSKAWLHWDQFRGHTQTEFLAWLRTILSREIIDAVRRYRRRGGDRVHSIDDSQANVGEWLEADLTTPSGKVQRQERNVRVAAAVHSLPPAQRTAIELHYLHQCSIQQVCTQMRRTPASVAGLLRRGLSTLRNQLDLTV